MVRIGKIVISVTATTGYNDEILSSPDRRYKRFLLYLILGFVQSGPDPSHVGLVQVSVEVRSNMFD